MVLSHFFSHPFPETLNRVEIRTVARQRDERESQRRRSVLCKFCSVTWCAIPNDDCRTSGGFQPASNTFEKLGGVFAIAAAFVPDKALTGGKVVSAIPVNPIAQRSTITLTPSWFASLCPGVAKVHVSVKVRFIEIEQADFTLADLRIERLKRLDVGNSFRRVGFLEHFLAFLPTQVVLLQNLVQSAMTDFAAEDSFDPTVQFLDAPVVPR